MCEGLEMLLKTRLLINAYYCADLDVEVQKVAYHRVVTLARQYPKLLSPAFANKMLQCPRDVRDINH